MLELKPEAQAKDQLTLTFACASGFNPTTLTES